MFTFIVHQIIKRGFGRYVEYLNQTELIEKCRYYKGEPDCPTSDNGQDWYFWLTEQRWVLGGGQYSQPNYELLGFWKLGEFDTDDGVPLSLRIELVGLFDHLAGSPSATFGERFKDWYRHDYKRES